MKYLTPFLASLSTLSAPLTTGYWLLATDY